MAARPNVLFVITDQHRPDHTGFGGNAVVQTPHLDAIAARGVQFTNAYVTNPICMPNRATILTGRVPSVHGVRFNGISLDWGANTFVRSLRSAGYRTGLVGKAHFQNMGHGAGIAGAVFPGDGDAVTTPWPDGWDLWENELRHREGDVTLPPDWYGFDNVELVVDHADRGGGHYHQWLKRHGVDPDAVQGPAHQLQAAAVGWDQIYQPALPEELYPTSYVAERSVAFIEQHAREHAADPFFLQVSFPDPHHPFTPPGHYYDMYDPADIELPRTFGDTHERSLPHIAGLARHRGSQRPGLMVAPFAPSEEQYREAAAKEYGMITMIDDAVGRVLAALDASGLADDTVTVFTSDHGEMFGDHGIMLKGGFHYQGCVRVPLVIAGASGPAGAGAVCDQLVSSIDLPETLLELAGCEEFHGMQGHSLVPLLAAPTDASAGVRDRVYVEEDEIFDVLGTGRPLRMRTIITGQGRLTRYEGVPQGELFDLANDPDEMANRYGLADTASVALQCDLTERLVGAMIDHADDAPKPTHFA